ncbi:MAG: AI-2E family transporter [Holosporales bacterium]|nr:AI-2E family transporter [Holosporales bacterium]
MIFPLHNEKKAMFAFWVTVAASLCFLTYFMGQWLIPFVIALILAYVFHVPVNFISRSLRLNRSLSAGCVVILLVSVVSFFTVFFVPLLKNAMFVLIKKLPTFLQLFPRFLNNFLNDISQSCGVEKTFDVGESFRQYFSEITTYFPSYVLNFINTGITVVYAVMFTFITPTITFYLLKDWDKIEIAVKTLLEKVTSNSVLTAIQLVNFKLAAYVKGQIFICMILAILYTIGLMLIGTNEYVVCGIFSGVFSVAPFFGPLLGLLISLVMSFDDFVSAYQYIATVGLFVVTPFVDSNFLTPKLIGKVTGIQPVWLLFSICATTSILGISGIFIAVPLAVIFSTICKELIKKI